MNEEELTKKLEAMERPDLSSKLHQKQLKLVLLSARRSSRIGVVLIALPCLFMFGVILKYGFRIDIPVFGALEEYMAAVDRTVFRFVPPLILVGGPLAGLALNLLAVLHFQFDRQQRELQVTVKLKPVNLAIIGVCLFILAMICMYVVVENGLPFVNRGPQ
jgi:hypothetical protein